MADTSKVFMDRKDKEELEDQLNVTKEDLLRHMDKRFIQLVIIMVLCAAVFLWAMKG
jgi:hypothetical protein